MNPIIERALRRLGITGNYRGYRQLAMALALVLEDEDRLYSIQREVYQVVAAELHCNPDTIERNIRTVLQRVWKTNRAQLNLFAGFDLIEPPKPAEFIDIIANRIRRSVNVH